ncbi:YraN family protein [Pseudonocardiaceae bacterium YIM PH 21723]|nr:YraN family protein [Pseudonocardiaceae bacterium YIM PH 21723]
MTTTATAELGTAGEQLATDHLTGHGMVILARNWRGRNGELDVIATDGDQLIVCEVKTRRAATVALPEDAVDDAKARRIRTLAQEWLDSHGLNACAVRYDIIAIIWPPDGTPQLRHIEEAF